MAPAERYRVLLVVLALDVRDVDYARICRVFNVDAATDRAFEKRVGRARKAIGLRIRQRTILDESKLYPDQAALHEAIREHTAGIAVFEMIDALDDPDLDYEALWESLCAVAATLQPLAA